MDLKEFLNPKSMLTPGIAGGIMMLIVNGVKGPFPEVPGRYLALAVSLVLGALVVWDAVKDLRLLRRGMYWVLASLAIFVMGWGANGIGQDATEPSTHATKTPFTAILSSAYAQSTPTHSSSSTDGEVKKETGGGKDTQPGEDKKGTPNTGKKTVEKAPAKKQSPDSGFFKKW
jgi:hypothetical protein